jgi:CubicO group peptidase (beta-lactamase class C family)
MTTDTRTTRRHGEPAARRAARRAAITALCLVPTTLQAQTRADLVRRIDSIAAAPVAGGTVAGLAIAVVKGTDTLLFKGYGFADLENRVPVTPTTVFRIGSVTKQFTSAAIMQLVEQQRLRLDDPLTAYLPAFPTHGRQITVRHLLNHTSGIPSYTDIGAPFGAVSRLDLAPDSLLAIVAHDSLMFEPGSHFYYNNTGYFMLGMIIDRIVQQRYGAYLEERLFAPLHLTQTIYCDTRRIIPQRAHGYDRGPSGLVNTEFISMQLPAAAGSLCSTVGDLVSWTRQLASGQVVSAASYREMTTPVTLSSGRPMSYGYGLSANTRLGHRVIEHGGGINGFISQLSYAPDDSLIVAVLSNTSPAPSSAVADAVLRTVLALPLAAAPAVPKDLALSAAERAVYAGAYRLTTPDGTRQAVRVIERNGQLMLERGAQVMRLTSQGDHLFLAGDTRLAFDVRDGRATGFVWGSGSRTLEGRRVD